MIVKTATIKLRGRNSRRPQLVATVGDRDLSILPTTSPTRKRGVLYADPGAIALMQPNDRIAIESNRGVYWQLKDNHSADARQEVVA